MEVLDERAVVREVTLQGAQLLRIDSPSTVPSEETAANTLYHYRFVWVDGVSTVDEVAEELQSWFVRRDGCQFVSTRGATTASRNPTMTTTSATEDNEAGNGKNVGPATFLAVVRDGLAQDGGLYVPTSLRSIPSSQWQYLITHKGLVYQDVAQFVLERLVDPSELPAGVLRSLLSQAYHETRWADSRVCPVTPLLPPSSSSLSWDVTKRIAMLELYHGPTAAFKDFALQLFPYFFSFSTSGLGHFMILAATSGDTGVAAIVGFLNSAPDTKVMVLYPDHGVSPVQKIQMQSCDDGATVRVFGVDSDFDFCQSTVKQIFQSRDIETKLHKEHQLSLSSANSINYGRLIPQVVYYAFAYRELVQAGTLPYGAPFDVCVPCGNFGNILSCLLAKRLGLPVRKMVVASNKNDVLADFIQTGIYDISRRSLHVTASPSIDILNASNIERLLYFLADGNTAVVSGYMKQLETEKKFVVSEAIREQLGELFTSERCTEEECFGIIQEVYQASNGSRLVDPHTGVALFAAKAYLAKTAATDAAVPLVVASTAHWAKFPEPVLAALNPTAPALAATSQGDDALAKVKTLHAAVGAPVHPSLLAAVAKVEAQGDAVTKRNVPKEETTIVQELYKFAAVA